MTRKAILLASSSGSSASPNFDLEDLYSFLVSDFGGAWEKDEVSCHRIFERQEALDLVRAAGGPDYSFIYFNGVGEKVKDGLPWAEMRLLLDSEETVAERELNPGSRRCTIFLDCSGNLPRQPIALGWESPGSERSASAARALYEQQLTSAEAGLVRIYATVGSRGNRGLRSFTEGVLVGTRDWLKDNKGILSLADMVRLARHEGGEGGTQVEYLGGRRLHHFPFALRL